MALAEDPTYLSDDQINKILENYRQTAWIMCHGGSPELWAALGKLLKVAYMNKDLELERMQLLITRSNFLQCVNEVVADLRNACVGAFYWFKSFYERVGDKLKHKVDYYIDKEITEFNDIHSAYQEWIERIDAEYFVKCRLAIDKLAEVYVRYITTIGTVIDDIIKILAAVCKEILYVEAKLMNLRSEATVKIEQVKQACFDKSHNIPPGQLQVQFYFHIIFMKSLHKAQERMTYVGFYGIFDTLRKSSTISKEEYLQFVGNCNAGVESVNKTIKEEEKNLQSEIQENINKLKNKNK